MPGNVVVNSALRDVAQRYCVCRLGQGIPSRDEFLPNVAVMAQLDQHTHHPGIVNLLRTVQFPATRIARCMHMPNHVVILSQPPDYIAVHDPDMIDIEQQLHVRRISLSG
jgi:hypothetical protein